ncbi:MAG: MFS transporter [Proteobacteria bacterium]|nr:MFS transporter [Pseudomonadota bacterium]
MGVGSLPLYALAVLAPYLTADLALSRTQFGLLATVLLVVAALLATSMGRLVDSFGGRRMLIVLFAAFATTVIGVAAAPAYLYVLPAVAVGGFALAITNPVTNQLVVRHIAAGRQGWLIGLKQSGAQLSAVVAGVFLPAGALLLGWRGALAALGVLSVIGVVATLWLVPAPSQASAAGSRPTRARATLRGDPLRAVHWLAAYACLMAAGGGAITIYLPLYVVERFQASPELAGLTAAGLGLVGFTARFLSGPISGQIRKLSVPLTVLAFVSAVATALLWAAGYAGFWLVWGAVILFGLSGAAWNTTSTLAVLREVDPAIVGQASGMVLRAAYTGGLLSPIGFGFLVDQTGGYGIGLLVAILLQVAAAATVFRLYLWQRGAEDSARLA